MPEKILKYKTGYIGIALITPVLVDRETSTSVFIGKNRHAKRSEWYQYFDTWEDAFCYLKTKCEAEVKLKTDRLNQAKDMLEKVLNMKPFD